MPAGLASHPTALRADPTIRPAAHRAAADRVAPRLSSLRTGTSIARPVIGEAVPDAVDGQHVAGPARVRLELAPQVLDV